MRRANTFLHDLVLGRLGLLFRLNSQALFASHPFRLGRVRLFFGVITGLDLSNRAQVSLEVDEAAALAVCAFVQVIVIGHIEVGLLLLQRIQFNVAFFNFVRFIRILGRSFFLLVNRHVYSIYLRLVQLLVAQDLLLALGRYPVFWLHNHIFHRFFERLRSHYRAWESVLLEVGHLLVFD